MNFNNWTGNGLFGKWEDDLFGLPSYVFNPQTNFNPQTTEKNLVHSPYHQIGNNRITATVCEDGYLQLYNSDRGLTCITPYQPILNLFGGGIGVLNFSDGSKVYLRKSFLKKENCKEVCFGMGYAKFIFNVHNIEIELLHWAPYGDFSAVITDVKINTRNAKIFPSSFSLLFSVGYYFIDFYPICSGTRREHFGPPPFWNLISFVSRYILYPLKLTTNYRRCKFAKKFKYQTMQMPYGAVCVTPEKTKIKKFNSQKPYNKNIFPLTFFTKGYGGKQKIKIINSKNFFNNAGEIIYSQTKNVLKNNNFTFYHPVVVMNTFKINPEKKQNNFRIIWGYENPIKINSRLRRLKDWKIEENIDSRKRKLCYFSIPNVPWVKREWMWHSDYLQSAAMYDDYFKTHTVRQGSAYYFIQGIDGAPRDFALFTIPLCYLNPKLAKEILITMLKITYTNGRLPYAIYGYGKVSGFGIHDRPSDIFLAFLWALTEYIFAVRDFNFLDEIFPYYPLAEKKYRTVRKQIEQTCSYIMYTLATGDNGLLRVGTGDWNDPLQWHIKNRSAFFKKGESTYNTAMAVYVLPKVADLLSLWNKNLADKLLQFTDNLSSALKNQFNGKWLYRGWNGAGNPIGKKNIYLEHHGWALLTEVLAKKQKEKIIKYIYKYLDKPSPIGANILYPPKKLTLNLQPKGWDTNGGVWYAANLLLSWGYGKINKNFAKESLLKNTLCAHSENYPHIWFGIWSGPDSYNAHYAKNAGETFYHITPMADFPLMNANAHSNPLTSAIKLCGIEPTIDGFKIEPLLPDEEFEIKMPLLSLIKTNNSLHFSYNFLLPQSRDKKLKFVVSDRNFFNKEIKIIAAEKEINFKREKENKILFEIDVSNKKNIEWEILITDNT